MPDPTTETDVKPSPAISATERAVEALVGVIERSSSPEMIRSRQILARRLALSGSAVPSRVPAPLNITEVGGYINLLEEMHDRETLRQLVSAALGVAGPIGADADDPLAAPPALNFVELTNQRPPDGPGLAAAPLAFSARSDFIAPLREALDKVARVGCVLPLVNIPARPQPTGVPAPSDLLALIGRAMMIVPGAAANAPAADVVVIARPAPGGAAAGALAVMLRQVTAAAPDAAAVVQGSFSAVGTRVGGGAGVAETVLPLSLFDPNTLLRAAGWFNFGPITLARLPADTSWARLENTTGLVPGVTRLRDELFNLYSPAQINSSNVRDLLEFVWDGQKFRA